MINYRVDLSQFDIMANKLLNWPVNTAMREIGKIGVDLVRGNFQNQSSFDGTPWAALSPVTINSRLARGSSSTRKLMDTLTLFNSIKFSSSKSFTILEVGNSSRDASVQNYGNPNNVFNGRVAPIPARPFLPNERNIPDAWVEDFKFPVIQAIQQAIK